MSQDINLHAEQISKLRRWEGDYSCRGLEFPLPLSKIGIFKENNNVSVNVLATGGRKEKIYILRNAKFDN